MSEPVPTPARVGALDGLRGAAIVLVVLSHSWTLLSFDTIDRHGLLRAVFRNGDAAVSVFLVASGFLTHRALLRRGGGSPVHIGVTLLRRVLRVGPALWLMLATVTVVAALDPTDHTTWTDNGRSALRAVTYTYNWFVEDHIFQARYDLGHLWYLAVDMQAFVLMALLVRALRRRPIGLVAALTGCFLLGVWWRFHVSGTEQVFRVLVRTTARMDAFVVGLLAAAVVALVVRHHQPDPVVVRRVGATSLVLLLPLLYWCAEDPLGDADASFLGWGGTFLELDLAVVCAASALGGLGVLDRVVQWRPLVTLGGASLVIYVWHYPVFAFVQRHSHGWAGWSRYLLALAILAVLWLLTERLVERRVARALASPRWRALDDGIPAYVARRLGTGSAADADGVVAPGVELHDEQPVGHARGDVDRP